MRKSGEKETQKLMARNSTKLSASDFSYQRHFVRIVIILTFLGYKLNPVYYWFENLNQCGENKQMIKIKIFSIL